jgi:hypothetical protein
MPFKKPVFCHCLNSPFPVMFEDAEDEFGGALARANMTAMITTTMTANPFGQIRLFPITKFLMMTANILKICYLFLLAGYSSCCNVIKKLCILHTIKAAFLKYSAAIVI